jgi:hypothetical protein
MKNLCVLLLALFVAGCGGYHSNNNGGVVARSTSTHWCLTARPTETRHFL